MPAQVELDVYSGMPNPTWTLTDAECLAFREQLAGLPRMEAGNLRGTLGYRGLIVQLHPGTNSEFVRVSGGMIEITRGVEKRYAVDAARKVERWLLDTGRPSLPGDLFELAQRDLG
jgi:hypothetical protein